MKLVFPILRLNWYRVIASTLDAALQAGCEVECWHSVGGNHWPANRPCRERVPHFKFGTPTIRDYHDDAEFLKLCETHCPDAIVSISLVWESLLPAWENFKAHPPWIILATNDTFAHCNRKEQLFACDLITVRSPHEKSCLVHDHTRDLTDWLQEVRQHPEQRGKLFVNLVEGRHPGKWTEEMVAYFKCQTYCTGYPLLDTVLDINPQELRERWGIPPGKPVVSCLASSYGMVMGAPWEKGFVSRHPLGRLFWSLRQNGIRGLRIPPNEAAVMSALRDFCDRNNAFLLLKMRHSQTADPLMNAIADRILGEENYYPHTAVEMAVLSDVSFGFFTTGAPEGIAAGKPFVDLQIPGYNREDWLRSASMFEGMFDADGVSQTLPATTWIQETSRQNLDTFRCEPDALKAYQQKYCGPMDGKHSVRVIRSIEIFLADKKPETDSSGFVSP